MTMNDFKILQEQHEENRKALLGTACMVADLVEEGKEVYPEAREAFVRAKKAYLASENDLKYAFELEMKELADA